MTRCLLDTSVVIAWDEPEVLDALPEEIAISTVTLAELGIGPHTASDPVERARRQTRLQQAEALFDSIDFDRAAARRFGEVVAAVKAVGRSHRPRAIDLMIAAVAAANGLPLYTRNPADFAGLDELVTVVAV